MEDTQLVKEVKVPKVLKLKHLEVFKELQGNISTNNVLKMISIVCDLQMDEVVRFRPVDIIGIYKEILLSVYKVQALKELPKEVEILGQQYYLANPATQPISWLIDSNALVTEDKPEMKVAFMYLEKGKKYGQVDENKNIINSVYVRAAIFKENFPINIYLTLIVSYAKAIENLIKIVGKEEEEEEKQTPTPYAWENLIIAVGKEFNMDFHEVLKLNIKTFMHYTKIHFHNMKQKLHEANVRHR
jgi:hypothetical protein